MNKLVFAAVVAFFSSVSVASAVEVGTPNPGGAFPGTLLSQECPFGPAVTVDDCAALAAQEGEVILEFIEDRYDVDASVREGATLMLMEAVVRYHKKVTAWDRGVRDAGLLEVGTAAYASLNDVAVNQRKLDEAMRKLLQLVLDAAKL